MSHHQPRSYPNRLTPCLKLSGAAWLLLLISACQGTEWGEQLGRAVQPVGSLTRVPAPSPSTSPDVSSTETPTPPQPVPGSTPTSSLTTPLSTPSLPLPSEISSRFVDLEPGSLVARSVSRLEQLGVFADLTGNEFQPQRSIRRGEFARWLVLANNALHADEPSRQIRLRSGSERPIFLDVPEEDPNFRYIQALGSAGLITGDAHQEFRPNSLLSRAELIRMKVPLDLPPGQVKGSRQELEEVWGFTDAATIPDEAIAPLVADRSLNSASTVLRTFGPIRTFNPFEPVSRGEAAIALSAFGERTAQDARPQTLAPSSLQPTPGLPESEPPESEPPKSESSESAPSPSRVEPEQTPAPEPTPSPDPTPAQEDSEDSQATNPVPLNPPEAAPGEIITPNEPQP